MMILEIAALLLTGLLILLIFAVIMAKSQDKAPRVTFMLLIISLITGMTVYLIGYIPAQGSIGGDARALLQALCSTGKMFTFDNDFIAIQHNGITNSLAYLIVFWAGHVLTIAVVVMAGFSILGKKLLSKMRRFFNFYDTYIIFGANAKSICLARNILTKDGSQRSRKSGRCVVFIDETADDKTKLEIGDVGGIYIDSPIFSGNTLNIKALKKAGLKNLRLTRKSIYVFAFTDDDMVNFNIIIDVLNFSHEQGIPDMLLKGLYIHTDSEAIIDELSKKAQEYAYNFNYFCESDLAARKLFDTCPLYKLLNFASKTGLPVQKMTLTILILGFGKTGRQILRKALYNGQFEGCTFETVVVDKNMREIDGHFKNNFPALFSDEKPEKLKIDLIEKNIQSDSFYRSLEKYINKSDTGNEFKIDMVVSCLGDDDLNFEIVADVRRFLKKHSVVNLPVLSAHITDKRYQLFSTGKEEDLDGIHIFGEYDELFTDNILINEQMDLMAKAVDASYRYAELAELSEGKKLEANDQDWAALSTHMKNSNRAYAGFMGAFLYILGLDCKTKDEGATEEETLSEEEFRNIFAENPVLQENLGKTEHLRWNSFHYASGWVKKPMNEITGQKPRADEINKVHPCLVPWEELPVVGKMIIKKSKNSGLPQSEIVKAIEDNDFQKKDRSNILNLYKIIESYNRGVPEKRKLSLVRRK